MRDLAHKVQPKRGDSVKTVVTPPLFFWEVDFQGSNDLIPYMDAEVCVWRRLVILSPLQHPGHLFATLYEISTDTTPDYNLEDFSDAIWINPNDPMLKLSHGAPQKTDLLPVVRFCYGERGGLAGPEPTRYGDWEQGGRCTDF